MNTGDPGRGTGPRRLGIEERHPARPHYQRREPDHRHRRRQVEHRSPRACGAVHRLGDPSGSMGLPVIGNHVGAVVPGLRANLGLRRLLGLRGPHRCRQPPRHRDGRNPVRYRRPILDAPLGLGRRQRPSGSSSRAARPFPVRLRSPALNQLCHTHPGHALLHEPIVSITSSTVSRVSTASARGEVLYCGGRWSSPASRIGVSSSSPSGCARAAPSHAGE